MRLMQTSLMAGSRNLVAGGLRPLALPSAATKGPRVGWGGLVEGAAEVCGWDATVAVERRLSGRPSRPWALTSWWVGRRSGPNPVWWAGLLTAISRVRPPGGLGPCPTSRISMRRGCWAV